MAGTLGVTGDQTNSGNLTVSGAFTSQGIDDNADATAITIDSNERVAVGHSTTGGANLAICDGANSSIQIFAEVATDTNLIQHYDQTSTAYMNAQYSGATHQFLIGTSESMRIDSNGKLLVGSTTNTNARIVSVADLSAMHTCTFQNSANNTGNIFLRQQNYLGQDCGNIVQSGSTTVSYGTSSDYRLKENVVYDFDATTRLKKLKPCRFNFIADGTDKVVDGFLAHEVANDVDDNAIVPEAIVGQKDAVDDDGNPILQQIDQSKLVPLLVKTIQELEARITALENAE
jgi:hypothetical protein